MQLITVATPLMMPTTPAHKHIAENLQLVSSAIKQYRTKISMFANLDNLSKIRERFNENEHKSHENILNLLHNT
jgi:hypothetical protein